MNTLILLSEPKSPKRRRNPSEWICYLFDHKRKTPEGHTVYIGNCLRCGEWIS